MKKLRFLYIRLLWAKLASCMADYRVNLDIYNGPLDLLLYLIRRDEIDVHDIPIARITQQYCQYVDTLKLLDPDLAGEFLVMAATLLEVKTRMLLPSPPPEEGAEPVDPRSDLVRQLLEYKAFKDAAGTLRQAATHQLQRYPRRPGQLEQDEQAKDLQDVQIWDLVEAFNSLLSSIGQGTKQAEIIYDDTPIELHAEDILDRLAREGGMTFRAIFAGRGNRTELVGLFLAMLELIRRRRIRVQQEGPFGEIYIRINPNPSVVLPGDAQPPAEQAAPGDSPASAQPAPAPAEQHPPAQASSVGQYISDRPAAGQDETTAGGVDLAEEPPSPEKPEDGAEDRDEPPGEAEGTGV